MIRLDSFDIVRRKEKEEEEEKERNNRNGKREREENSRSAITLIGISGLSGSRSRSLMNTRENRYNVGIQNKRRASNAVQSDCGLNERYYATSSGAGTEKEREKERKKKYL